VDWALTTIRGKGPLTLIFSPKVSVTYSSSEHPIRIASGLWEKGTRIEAFGELSPGCVATLIVELRKALRTVRDERVRALNGNVLEAEKPLP
jgi:hypothetical protein